MDDILKRVAAGELSPEEAIRRLDAGKPDATKPDAGRQGAPIWAERPTDPRTEEGPRIPDGDDVTGIRISASYRNLDVIADPAVATAYAEGEHVARREGGALEIDGRGAGLFGVGGPGDDPSNWRFGFGGAIPRGRAISRGLWDHHLTVRVNPQLPLHIDAIGSKLRLRGGEAGAELQLVASSVNLEAVRGPLRIDTNTSSVKGSVAPYGDSRVQAEQSSVKIVLLPGTDVLIKVRNRMSKVVLPDRVGRSRQVKQEQAELLVGEGNGVLVLDAMMSSVMLSNLQNAEARA